MSDYAPPFHLTDAITDLISEISELLGMIAVDTHFSPDPMLRRNSRIRTIHSSLAIEQNTLSLDQVTAVIEGKRILGPPKDIQEVRNAFEAYERMSGLNPLSMEDLLLAHRLMMKDLIPDSGCFRTGNVGVFQGSQLIHAGTPAAYVPEVMEQLFRWLGNTTMHPLIRGAVFHFEFEYIHPFSDGNGRTGRLWHSLILQQWRPILAWLPVESMIREHQGEYYKTLESSQHQGESTDFVAFMLRMLRDTLREIREDQQAYAAEHVVDNVVDNVADNVGEKPQQTAMAVLTILRKRPRSSAHEIGQLIGLSARQVQRVMAELQAEGLLIRHGSPRNGYWEITEQK